MISTEPLLHCMMDDSRKVPLTEFCDEAEPIKFFPYSCASAVGMVLYYVLLIDFCVFNNRISAYALVAGKMIPEVLLFLLALSFSVLTFSCAFSCLVQEIREFH